VCERYNSALTRSVITRLQCIFKYLYLCARSLAFWFAISFPSIPEWLAILINFIHKLTCLEADKEVFEDFWKYLEICWMPSYQQLLLLSHSCRTYGHPPPNSLLRSAERIVWSFWFPEQCLQLHNHHYCLFPTTLVSDLTSSNSD